MLLLLHHLSLKKGFLMCARDKLTHLNLKEFTHLITLKIFT